MKKDKSLIIYKLLEKKLEEKMQDMQKSLESRRPINGQKGERGYQGERGYTGEKGEKGLQGIEGVQGIQGIEGKQGIQGEQGPQGIAGKDGVDGKGTRTAVAWAFGYKGEGFTLKPRDDAPLVAFLSTDKSDDQLMKGDFKGKWWNPTASISYGGGGGAGGGASELNDLSDVTITTPTNGQVLAYNGSAWVNSAEAGLGDVTGPGSSTDNTLPRFDSTTGKVLQGSSIVVDDSDNVTGMGTLNGRTLATDGSKLDGIEAGATADQSASEILTAIKTVDGATSGLDADLLDGIDSDVFIAAGLNTGVLTGGVLSVGSPNTTFTISDGNGFIVDNYTDPANPTISAVSWSSETNLAVDNLLTNLLTYVSIDSGGLVVQRTTRWTPAQMRDEIVLGVVVHVNLTTVDTVNNEQQPVGDVASQLTDLFSGLGFINVTGNAFSANGANLNVDKTAGNIMNHGINWDIDPKNPHLKTLAALTALTFQYRFQDGTNGVTGTDIDPDIYDVNGTSTAVPNNKWTIQRIYSFVSNNVKIQPGQALYSSLADAKAALQIESFTTEPSIESNGLLRAFIIVKHGTTDLSDSTKALFLQAGKFGSTSGTTGLSVSTLQSAYNNSETAPEISTTDAGGALNLRRGTTGGDSDLVLEVENNAGTGTFAVAGDGTVTTSSTIDGRDVATDGTKLDGIESGATADQSNAEIKTAYEANANTNEFSDSEQTKLAGIETAADVTDATNVNAAGAVMESDVTAKGQIFVATASGTLTQLAVGTNDQVLTADSAEASGVKWAAGGGGATSTDDIYKINIAYGFGG